MFTPIRMRMSTPLSSEYVRERLLHPQRGADGAFGVVLVGDGRPEQGDDCVADDLVHPAAERRHVADQALERRVDDSLHPFGIEALGERREPDEVGEDDRDDAALLRRGAQGLAARPAEPRPARAFGATARAVHDPVSLRGRAVGRPRDSPGRARRPRGPTGRIAGRPTEPFPHDLCSPGVTPNTMRHGCAGSEAHRRVGRGATVGDRSTTAEPARGPDGDAVATGGTIRSRPAWVLPFAFVAFAGVIISNLSGIATGDDGVGYRAIADSLLDGRGFGYFLENPVTVWPPIWPSLLYALAKVTPLDTLGAAVVLNAVTIFAAVLVGQPPAAATRGRRPVGDGRHRGDRPRTADRRLRPPADDGLRVRGPDPRLDAHAHALP